MRFRKYSGELKSRILLHATICILLLGLSIYLSVRIGEYQVVFILGLLPTIFVAAFTWLYFFQMARDDKANISDMIVLDEEGIKLECENGKNTVILWEDIIKIERRDNFRMSRSFHVMSKSGEEIWWYSASKKAKEYILEQHPELEKCYITKKGYY